MDIQLHYAERGAGKPLVLLHGNGEDGSYFVHQMEYFARNYRVVALDTRGHGQSPRGEAPFTIAQFAEDLNGFLDQMGIARASLLGFSDGANIALQFALKYPERVERLILNGGNLNPKGVKARYQVPITLGYGICALCARFSKAAVHNLELLALMVKEPRLDPAALGAVEAPTLVIAGTRDLIKEAHTGAIHAAIPGSRLALVEGGHFVAKENSEAFNAAVAAFLQDE